MCKPPAFLPGVCPEQAPLTKALSPFPGHYVIIHLYHNGHIIDTKETKSITSYNPVWNMPFLFNLPAGDIQQQELSLEFTVMQVSRMEGTMAKKVAWITHAQEPLLQPGGLSPHLRKGCRQARRSYFLLPTGGCWGGIALLGVMGFTSSA